MKKLIVLICLATAVAFMTFSWEAEHSHAPGEEHHHDKEQDQPDEHEDHVHDSGHHDEHEESSSNVGPGKAVIQASEDKGFRLSDVAIRTLGIQTITVEDTSSIPDSSLVFYQDMVGVYWLHDGWFKLIRPKRLERGDTIVTSGADLLRVVELDIFTEDVEGHSH